MTENFQLRSPDQIELFFQDKFIQENDLQVMLGNYRFKHRSIKDVIAKGVDSRKLSIVKEALVTAKSFLSLNRIRDNWFDDHTNRRKWRIAMSKKYGLPATRFLEANKYRINNITSVLGYTSLSIKYLLDLGDLELQHRLKTLQSSLPDFAGYHDLGYAEKDELIDKLDQCVIDFIEIVST